MITFGINLLKKQIFYHLLSFFIFYFLFEYRIEYWRI